MSKFAVVMCILLLVGFSAAQIPTGGNVFFGYSYYYTKLDLDRANLNGWEASFEGKIFPFVGIVADFSGHYGSQNFPNPGATCAIGVICGPLSATTDEENILFGPRLSVPVGRWRPFGEVLFGFGHASTQALDFGSDTSFASAVGGGLDYRIFRPLAWRFQGDYIHTHLFNLSQNNVRLSTGIVFRF